MLWAYGLVIREGPGGEQRLGEPWAKIARRFHAVMCVPHQATFHRRALFERVGGYNPSYRIAGDYALLIKAVRLGHRPAFASLVVSYMGGGGISSQPGSGVLALDELVWARAEAGMRPLRPLYWWWVYGKARVKAGLLRWFGDFVLSRAVDLYRALTGRPRYWRR